MGIKSWLFPLTKTRSKAGTAYAVSFPTLLLLKAPVHNGNHFKTRNLLYFKNSLTLFFHLSFPRNIIHGSDSVESAETEINLWFTAEELVDYRSCAHEWIYD